MELLNQLEQYRPFNEQEARDREELLRRVRSGEDLYTRDNPARPLHSLGLGGQSPPRSGAPGVS